MSYFVKSLITILNAYIQVNILLLNICRLSKKQINVAWTVSKKTVRLFWSVLAQVSVAIMSPHLFTRFHQLTNRIVAVTEIPRTRYCE